MLPEISPKYQSSLKYFVHALGGIHYRYSRLNQDIRTHTNRIRMFLRFFKNIHIKDPFMINILQDTRNYIMAIYALSLIGGSTLLCKTIETQTFSRYLFCIDNLIKHNITIANKIKIFIIKQIR